MAAEDFYLYFKGTQGHPTSPQDDSKFGGKELPQGEVDQMDEFVGIKERKGFKLNRWAWTGSIFGDVGVSAAHKKLESSREYVPGVSRLIIYGYSAGGKNVLDLCREFDKTNAGPAPPVVVTVDLLVTVDAAAWRQSDKVDRRLAKCVKRNLNYFQTSGGASGSYGAANERAFENQQKDDIPRSEEHAKINDAVRPKVKEIIQNVLDGTSTEVPLLGQWDWMIGSFNGLLEFSTNGNTSWQHADPAKLKADPKKRPGTWWEVGGEVRWSYKLANPQDERIFVVHRPLSYTARGNILPVGAGFFDMTKRW